MEPLIVMPAEQKVKYLAQLEKEQAERDRINKTNDEMFKNNVDPIALYRKTESYRLVRGLSVKN
jgi:hypothetical protein